MDIGLLYSHLSERGGVENVILKQAELLRSRGHNARCYFAYLERNVLRSDACDYVDSYFRGLLPNNKTTRIVLSLPLAPLTYRNLKDIEILICHGYGPAPWIGYVQKMMRKIKYVSYIHFLPRMFYLGSEETKLWRYDSTRNLVYWISRFSDPLVKRTDMLGVSNSDHIMVNSLFMKRRVKRVYGLDSTVCYPPVETSIFRKLKHAEIRYIQSESEHPMIFSSGRIVPIKRWDLLIRVLPHIKRVYPNVSLAIAGDISPESQRYCYELMELSKSLGVDKNVQFLGFKSLEELVRLYNAADAYAYITPTEDFGLGPVEAMACGTPAVVWDDGAGPTETVINGKTGFRAKPYNLEDFAEKILSTFELDKESIGTYLHQHVESNFSSQNHLRILEEVLEDL